MDYKRNSRYFTSPWLGKLAAICWPVAAIGVVVVFLQISWITYTLGGIIALAAILCGIVLNSISVNDKEYDSLCAGLKKTFRERFSEYVYGKINAHNSRGKAPVAVDEEKIAVAQTFLYDPTTLSRLGQDGRRRSSKLILCACYPDKQAVYMGYELHGITSELKEEAFGAYPYAEIESITTEKPDSPYAEYEKLFIKLKSKETPVMLYIATDAEMEKMLATVRTRMGKE